MERSQECLEMPEVMPSAPRPTDELRADLRESLGQVLGGVANDLIRYVHTMEQLTEALLSELGEDHAGAPLVQAMASATLQAAPLARLLSSCTPDGGKRGFSDANRMLLGLQPHLRRVIPAGAGLELDMAPGIAIGRFDAGGIEQILLRLQTAMRPRMRAGSSVRIQSRIEGPPLHRQWVGKLSYAGVEGRRQLPAAWPDLVLLARRAGGKLALGHIGPDENAAFSLRLPLTALGDKMAQLRENLKRLERNQKDLRAAAAQARLQGEQAAAAVAESQARRRRARAAKVVELRLGAAAGNRRPGR